MVVGITIFLGGVVMLVTPGPAFVLIPIGLAILSLEFAWAERLLERSLEEADKAKRKAAATSTTQKVVTGVAVALGVGALIAWAIVGDIPIVPV